MSNKVSIDLLADDKAVLKALQKVVSGLDKVEARTANLEKTSRRGAKTAETGFEQVRKKLGGMVKEMFGFQSASAAALQVVQALRAEFEKVQRLRQESANAGATAGEAIRNAGVNFQGDATVSKEQLGSEILRIAKSTRTPVPIVSQAVSAAASAKGDSSNRRAIDAVEQALRILPGDAESAVELSSRALDLQKISGAKDIRQSIGSLVELQGASRTIDLGLLGASAPSVVKAVTQAGGTAEQGKELFATITQLAQDAEGRRSATGAIALTNAIENFNPTRDAKTRKGEEIGLNQSQIDKFNSARGFNEKLGVLQGDRQLAEAFKGSNTFEKRVEGAIFDLVFGTESGLREFRSAQEKISPTGDGLTQVFEDKVRFLDSLPFQSSLRAKQQSSTNIEGSRLTSDSQRAGAAGDILGKSLDNVNLPGLDVIERAQQLTEYEVQVQRGVAPEQAAINQLRGLQEGGLLGGVSTKDSALLGKQIELLQSLLDEARKGNPSTGGKKAIELNGRKD